MEGISLLGSHTCGKKPRFSTLDYGILWSHWALPRVQGNMKSASTQHPDCTVSIEHTTIWILNALTCSKLEFSELWVRVWEVERTRKIVHWNRTTVPNLCSAIFPFISKTKITFSVPVELFFMLPLFPVPEFSSSTLFLLRNIRQRNRYSGNNTFDSISITWTLRFQIIREFRVSQLTEGYKYLDR